MGDRAEYQRAKDGSRLPAEHIESEEPPVPSPRDEGGHEGPARSLDGAQAAPGEDSEEVKLALSLHEVGGDDDAAPERQHADHHDLRPEPIGGPPPEEGPDQRRDLYEDVQGNELGHLKAEGLGREDRGKEHHRVYPILVQEICPQKPPQLTV